MHTLVAVTEVVGLTLALSPVRRVNRGWLGIVEVCLLAIAIAVWGVRGRPGLPLQGFRSSAEEIISDPIVLAFLAAVLIALSY